MTTPPIHSPDAALHATAPQAGLPAPRSVAHDRPWAWLAAGWNDLWAAPGLGLSYGAALAVAGWALALLSQQVGTLWAILPATAGFFLVAPLLATGLYEASRRRELGLDCGWGQALAAFRRNASQLALLGGALLLIHLFWVRLAGLLFALCFGPGFAPPLEALPLALLREERLLPFLIAGTATGFLLAALTFGIGALSIPMLLERDISAVEAIIASWQGVMENWRPMALWAGLIVLFTGLALVPLFLGLAVALPLIGHATWHAYRDIYPDRPDIPGVTAAGS
ncbi:DUF2189 domain-containing protein [Pseudoroseomonas cervicalis]|uniref:DUF2189 domain-containing protein n=1 Tax=Teichococcus cervicalis TaxID=204525 RepID=UPI002785A459|nr:DUF2189 domain-containing protein [Pseudoroseomonas cervicalis]MDQ1080283.1 putative membrane protein [Pseudoroseomonas cervicalis]